MAYEISNWTYDDGLSVGPQPDGTYAYPAAALPNNLPANTAGNPSISDPSAFDILKYGVGVVTDLYKTGQAMDYNKWMATNGGIYREGRPAVVSGIATGTATGRLLLFGGILAAVLLLLPRRG